MFMTSTGSPREGGELYRRVGNLEGQMEAVQNDISALRGEADHQDERITSLEEDRTFRKGAKWMLRLIFGGIVLTLLEQWHFISKLVHAIMGQ